MAVSEPGLDRLPARTTTGQGCSQASQEQGDRGYTSLFGRLGVDCAVFQTLEIYEYGASQKYHTAKPVALSFYVWLRGSFALHNLWHVPGCPVAGPDVNSEPDRLHENSLRDSRVGNS